MRRSIDRSIGGDATDDACDGVDVLDAVHVVCVKESSAVETRSSSSWRRTKRGGIQCDDVDVNNDDDCAATRRGSKKEIVVDDENDDDDDDGFG